jgi:hypothetical protein
LSFPVGTCQFRDWQKPIFRLAKADAVFNPFSARLLVGYAGRLLVGQAGRLLAALFSPFFPTGLVSVGYRILGSVSIPLFGTDFTD